MGAGLNPHKMEELKVKNSIQEASEIEKISVCSGRSFCPSPNSSSAVFDPPKTTPGRIILPECVCVSVCCGECVVVCVCVCVHVSAL